MPLRPRPRPNLRPADERVPPERQKTSQETREKHRQNALERHRRGGFEKKPGKKRRKPSRRRVAMMVAEAATEKKNAAAIIEVFKDGIHPNQPMNIRLKAAEAWLGVEREEGKLALKEEDSEQQSMDREQALNYLAEHLTQGAAAAMIRKRIEAETEDTVIEGTVAEEIAEKHLQPDE